MRYLQSLLFLPFLLIQTTQAQSDGEQLEKAIQFFEQGYYALNLPAIALDFKANLNNEFNRQNGQQQAAFFKAMSAKLKDIDKQRLDKAQLFDFEILEFETTINQERLALIDKASKSDGISDLERLYDFENGANWYAWFVKKWTGSNMKPEAIMAYGKTEVTRVKAAIEALELPKEKPDEFLTRDQTKIINTLKEKSNHINTILGELMPDFPGLPNLLIRRGTNARLAQAPGYYNNNTFYFNLFDKPFDLADCDWLLIHEGNPGHHFEVNYRNINSLKAYRRGLRTMGFIEGWAAYTENLGWEMGLYQSPFEALGKWNWDLIRSVRVVLDVGLNFYGWTDEECRAYWKQHITGKDDIAEREINRMKRWPAQVLTYKLGEAAILKALEDDKQRLGEAFSWKQFHTKILSTGSVPLHLIGKT